MFARLLNRPQAQAAHMPDGRLTYGELERASAALAGRLPPRALALWATPSLATVVGLLAGLRAGVPLIPVNPKSGGGELEHVLADAEPHAVVVGPGVELPSALAALPRIDVNADDSATGTDPAEPPDDAAALIMYTSGTTGPPKGVVQTRRSLIANLDALARVWGLGGDDAILHALPLFHVHGLVLGTIGPLRLGARVRHLGAFDVESFAGALEESSVMFAVPTMYRRLLAAAERDERLREASRARACSPRARRRCRLTCTWRSSDSPAGAWSSAMA